ncbi:efflux RND transporter periplasmic adaptor subunit [Campylobacter upsaliensis]|uniref:efflux RND transporter periplasmic adaptor subunit n=1 Tax=Campylobacter felis TaxID=2974565 RepID=UPI001275A3F4|nr:efflux RND transporter periplasmic adaptor subunit [Campylobacter upsaliensis]MDL0114661.1 efflux RND transporter periplasmic adaptor subunit [Campylobacter felis]
MKQIWLLFLFSLSFVRAEELYASFNVEAKMQSRLVLESVGVVEQIFVEVSQNVKKGDLILSLDSKSEKIALQNAKNDHALALVEFQNAQSKMQKFKAVREVIDKQSFEDIQSAFNGARLRLEKAKLNIAYYENVLEKKRLVAPYDGIIANKFIQVGEGVGGVGRVLIEIFSYPDVKLILSFDEKFKDKVKLGQKFLYKIDTEQKQREGKIALIYPSIEPKTRKIYAEVYAKDLKPGLFGEGQIIIED